MTKCLCGRCSDDPSEKYSPAWMLETEAKLILTMPFEQRGRYLKKLKGQRRITLENEIKRIWNERIVDKAKNVT